MDDTHLDISRTYAAIVAAARARRFITYVEVAKASGVEWAKAYRPIGSHLDKLLAAAHRNGWPLLTSLVVRKEDAESGRLTDGARDGFLVGVKRLGITVSDAEADAFIEAEQRRTFEWAQAAPEAPEFGVTRTVRTVIARVAEPQADYRHGGEGTQYWFVGAVWGGEDQFERFIADGIWQNGNQDDPLVDEMRAGDRIAIKASYVRKHNLPFDVGGRPVSTMRIKATGIIRENLGDHATVRVDWDPHTEGREWFFYTYRVTIVRADPENSSARRLIDFAFSGHDQDPAFWLAQPYFRKKYAAADAGEMEEDDLVEDGEGSPYTIDDIVEEGCFFDRDVLVRALDRLRQKKNLILQGPPGTGKSWLAKRLGYAMLGTQEPAIVRQRMRVVQFHPTLSYEDFIRGWRPGSGNTLQLVDGPFLEAVQAAESEGGGFVFVIEEINRGNPAQIFGEMLTLLEESKRRNGEELELAYRREGGRNRFRLPNDLFVIGTMNLADRSLAIVDMALRRRFAFVTLAPAFGEAWRAWCLKTGRLPPTLVDEIRARMESLNEQIRRSASLGDQYCIGHSYFTPTSSIDQANDWYEGIVESEIEPLLAEYWYDDPAQVTAAASALRRPWS